jgi:hypothetical protein
MEIVIWLSELIKSICACCYHKCCGGSDSFVPGKHCVFSFTHEPAEGMDKKNAESYLCVLCVLSCHHVVLWQGLSLLIPEFLEKKIPMLSSNGLIPMLSRRMFALCPGCMKMKRTATSMGYLISIRVAVVQKRTALTQGIISWAISMHCMLCSTRSIRGEII